MTKIDEALDRFIFGGMVLLALTVVSCILLVFLLMLGIIPWYISLPVLAWAAWWIGKFKDYGENNE